MKITKAVLPVGGMGTRFLPVTKVIPKELLPLGNKPVIQYLAEEAVASGIEEIIFVISREKELIRDYFSPNAELEKRLGEKGKTEALENIRKLSRMAHFTYVYQEEPKGDGDAILYAEQEVGGEPFLILFGDDLVKSDVPAAKQLMDAFTGQSVIAVERVPKERISSYGVAAIGEQNGRKYKVTGLAEKPLPEEAPSDFGIIGKYVCAPEIFEALKTASSGRDGELRLIDGFIKLMESQDLFAYEIEGERFDTGTPDGLRNAINAFF